MRARTRAGYVEKHRRRTAARARPANTAAPPAANWVAVNNFHLAGRGGNRRINGIQFELRPTETAAPTARDSTALRLRFSALAAILAGARPAKGAPDNGR